jgi:hypothetical protein
VFQFVHLPEDSVVTFFGKLISCRWTGAAAAATLAVHSLSEEHDLTYAP